MTENNLTRREVIGGTVAGLGALTFAGHSLAGDDQPPKYNVGIASKRAERATKQAADQISQVVSWGAKEKTITGRFPDEALGGLRNRAGVRYIERDGLMQAIGSGGSSKGQTVPWGIDRVDAETAHANGATGGDDTDGEGGADIAIIDTGIDSDHPDLAPVLGEGTALVEAGTDYAEPWDDDQGHGTHVAGTAGAVDDDGGVVGVATEATLHAVKVLDSAGSGYYSDVAAGIQWVADQGYDVANLSLGGSHSNAVADAVEHAYDAGVLVVAAAGNYGPCEGCVVYPAREPEVVAVSATNPEDDVAVFSSTGPAVDIAAPGRGIYSTYPGGDYATLSGTSMASPHVAGAAGQLMDDGYSNRETRERLEATAEDVHLTGTEQGYGLLDVANALDLDSSDSVAEEPGTSTEPTIDTLEATIEESDVRVTWSVQDDDGDLQSADLTLSDVSSTGVTREIEDTVSLSIDGETASQTTSLDGDAGSDTTYRIRLAVSDAVGNLQTDSLEL